MSSKDIRPSSAKSRTAWGDYGTSVHASPDNDIEFGPREDPDILSSMENDSYVNKKSKSTNDVATTSQKKTGCWSCFSRGIRSLWATRMTEETEGDKDLNVKTTLRELIIYIVFLTILCVVTFGMTGSTMYYYTKVMNDLFLDATASDGGGSFRAIANVNDFWKFAKEPLLNGLYWEKWYNDADVPEDQLGYIYYENKLLGVPRFRQLKVSSNSCLVHDDFKDVIRECFDSYAENLEDKTSETDYGNYTGWTYQTSKELEGESHWGLLTTYSGAGYVQELTSRRNTSETIINYLFDNLWITRGTRAVFIDFTVYNANINLFCVVRLLVEFPATGGAIPSFSFRTVKLIRYVTVKDYFVLACEFIFLMFILYYMVEEGIEIKKHGWSYLKGFWNILDLIVILIAILCVVFDIYRTLVVGSKLKELLDNPDKYPDFENLSFWQTRFDNAIAINVFCAWIKIFKYISFNKTMTQLSSTLGKCAKDLAGFAVMFFIIFLAFTQLGYLLFGSQIQGFSNFQNAFFTLFRMILGDFDFHELEAANRLLGPIFFMLYVFFVFFVLLNMFLAIINDTYSEVKGDMVNQPNEFEMGDYFKRGYISMLAKLNIKRERIVDIQNAVNNADINQDNKLDFDEWRQDLKTRGYAEGEIEALFAKYDTNGDRVLDENDQKKMHADLNNQKNALNNEINEFEKSGNGSGTGRRSSSSVSFNDDSGEDCDDEDSGRKSSRSGKPSNGVSYEEFTVLSRRVDRVEHSIGSIVSKIDAVLVILDTVEKSDEKSEKYKRKQNEGLDGEEIESWDLEIPTSPISRVTTPSAKRIRSRSRPSSGQN